MKARDERGVIAVLVALLVVVLVGILAFVADFGYVYANQRNLQNAADAAVLAAGQQIVSTATPAQTCAQLIASTTLAETAAQAAFTQNASAGAMLSGGAVTFSCTDPAQTGRVVVSANGTQQSPSFFGGIYGKTGYTLNKPAKAIVGPPNKLVGVRPFALCDALGNIQNTQPDAYVNLDFDNADLGCGTASGNFGTLDIRYPAVGGAPGSLVDDWVRNGYSGYLPSTSPLTLEGSPGIPASNLADDFTAILDTPIVLPTFDMKTDHGSNATYNITGFVEVKVCGVKLTSGAGSLSQGTCFQSSSAPTDNNARFVQLKFVRFIAIGDLDLTCQIAAGCDPGVKVAKLAQ